MLIVQFNAYTEIKNIKRIYYIIVIYILYHEVLDRNPAVWFVYYISKQSSENILSPRIGHYVSYVIEVIMIAVVPGFIVIQKLND